MVKIPQMCTVSTQTEAIKINSLDNMQQSKKFSRPKTTLVQQKKWPDEKMEPPSAELDKLNTRNKGTQTQKVGVKRLGPETPSSQMGSLKAIMYKRRKQSVDRDRVRLRKLMEQINADPPPRWNEANIIWLDVDIVEKRIEEFEREETEMREELRECEI
ncbi:hypothetical protein ACLKA6_018339 [Drosophila palustris]